MYPLTVGPERVFTTTKRLHGKLMSSDVGYELSKTSYTVLTDENLCMCYDYGLERLGIGLFKECKQMRVNSRAAAGPNVQSLLTRPNDIQHGHDQSSIGHCVFQTIGSSQSAIPSRRLGATPWCNGLYTYEACW